MYQNLLETTILEIFLEGMIGFSATDQLCVGIAKKMLKYCLTEKTKSVNIVSIATNGRSPRGVAQLVACLPWAQEVAGSSPVAPIGCNELRE